MRDKPTPEVEKFRVTKGPLASSPEDGCNGAFQVTTPVGSQINVIASDGLDIVPQWEHVSVAASDHKRLPEWLEMHWIKEQFWKDEECVIQFHPPKSKYVNFNPYVLHMWRQVGVDHITPPAGLIAPSR